MSDRTAKLALHPTAASVALLAASLSVAPLAAQPLPAAAEGPRFVQLWIGGPLDSLYNAEYARLQQTCASSDDACFARELDTTAVRLARVFAAPDPARPAGWLVARLRTDGRWPYASLLYQPDTGPAVVLTENLGDWGYGTQLPLADVRGEWLRPAFAALTPPLWLSPDAAMPGLGVLEVYGLAGRLWNAGPLEGRRVADGTVVELPAGVYFIEEVAAGRVRMRPEVPGDMLCDPDAPPAPDKEAVQVFEVRLDDLLGPGGPPAVTPAYGKGC